MLRRIQSVLSPMSAMRVDPLAVNLQLQSKLHSATEYLVSSGKQFEAWMELQNHIRLHFTLFELYKRACSGQKYKTSGVISEEELISIMQFYTMILINCKDELLTCKMVSDDFVVQMCQFHHIRQDLASQLQPYRINLIKSYMGRITPEVVKYMVLQDKFKVFEACVTIYNSKLGSDTVEFTTVSNILINVLTKADSIPYLWENIWTTQGLQLLYTQSFEHILKQLKFQQQQNDTHSKSNEQKLLKVEQMTIVDNKDIISAQDNTKQQEQVQGSKPIQQIQTIQSVSIIKQQNNEYKQEQKSIKKQQPDEPTEAKIYMQMTQNIQQNTVIQNTNNQKKQQIQLDKQQVYRLQQISLFLTQLRHSVTQQQIVKTIEQYCYLSLQDVLDAIFQYERYSNRVLSFSILFLLFKTYSFELELIEKSVTELLNSILVYLQEDTDTQGRATMLSANQAELRCRSIFSLSKIACSKHSHITARVLDHGALDAVKIDEIKKMRSKILHTLVIQLSNCMEKFEHSPIAFTFQFIKNSLLTAFNLKIVMDAEFQKGSDSPTKQIKLEQMKVTEGQHKQISQKLSQTVLELFLSYTAQLKKIMGKTEQWANLIKWYEEGSLKVSQNILTIPDVFQHHCEDSVYLTLMLYEYIKNYRFMIVQYTTLSSKNMKQQKFYHIAFTSPGLAYQPGHLVTDKVNIICHCLFHHNYQQIPVVVVQDTQCFIVGMKTGEQAIKIVINIKWKDVDGFIYGNSLTSDGKTAGELPKFIKINLRGMQQIVLEFSNPKVVGNALKDYLIKCRDLNRQRQLSFFNQWIRQYQLDAQKSLQKVKHNLEKEDYLVP